MRIGEMSSNDFEFVIHKKLFSHDENSIGKRLDLNSACEKNIQAKIRKYDSHPKNTKKKIGRQVVVWGTVLAGAWAKNIPHNSQKVGTVQKKSIVVHTYTEKNKRQDVWGTVLAGAWAKKIPHNSQKVLYRNSDKT